jgi:hypothetical protein
VGDVLQEITSNSSLTLLEASDLSFVAEVREETLRLSLSLSFSVILFVSFSVE